MPRAVLRQVTDLRAALGHPGRVFCVGGYTVLVCNDNQLAQLS
jgi:hypothetical protein